MCDAYHEDEKVVLPYRVDDDIVFAGVDTTKLRATGQLLRTGPPGIVGEQLKPTDDPLLDVAGQAHHLPVGVGSEFDAVRHGSEPQVSLEALQRNGFLPGPLEFLNGLLTFFGPVAVFQFLQQLHVFHGYQGEEVLTAALHHDTLPSERNAVAKLGQMLAGLRDRYSGHEDLLLISNRTNCTNSTERSQY